MTSRRHTPPGTAPRNARQQGPQHPPPPAPIRLRAGRRLRARCVLSVRKSIRVFRLRIGGTNAMVTVVQWALAPTRGGNGPCRQRAREGAEVIHPEIYIRYTPSKIYTVYVLKFLKKTGSCGWVPFFSLAPAFANRAANVATRFDMDHISVSLGDSLLLVSNQNAFFQKKYFDMLGFPIDHRVGCTHNGQNPGEDIRMDHTENLTQHDTRTFGRTETTTIGFRDCNGGPDDAPPWRRSLAPV